MYPKKCKLPKTHDEYKKMIVDSETNVYAGGVFANPVRNKGLFDDIIKTIDLIPEKCNLVLDIGCNDGTIAKAIEIRKDVFVIGIDACYNHMIETRKNGITALYGDVYDMNLPYVDCVFMRHVIEHMYDIPTLLKYKLNTKYLVLAIPVCEHEDEITEKNIKEWHKHDRTHFNIGTLENWIEIIEDCGYRVTYADNEIVVDASLGECLTARILAKKVDNGK